MTKTNFDAKENILQHCKTLGMKPDKKGYVKSNQDNLIDNFDNWLEIKKELEEGQGNELKPDKYGIVKFNAVHSSSALCVNNFAPFKQHKDNISFLNYTGFTEASFEKKLPTGISVPNLDFYLESDNVVIGFESKFIEALSDKLPNKGNNLIKYQNKKELNYLPNNFPEIIQYYIDCENHLFLDVAQLIKHSIGLIKKGHAAAVKPILVYLYWQPNNWKDYDVYHKHLDEIRDFREKIERHLLFIPISYIEFWKLYENDKTFGKHIDKVKVRYNISFRGLS